MVSKTKRLIFVSALAFSLLTAGAYGAKQTFAQDNTVQETIVQKIATKFNLNVADVQAVFDQERAARHAEMEAKYEQRLTDAVAKGDLTEAKRQLILAKHKEIEADKKASMEKMKPLSNADRKALMDKKKADLKSWADTNGIDLKYLLGGFGKAGMHMGGKRGIEYKSN